MGEDARTRSVGGNRATGERIVKRSQIKPKRPRRGPMPEQIAAAVLARDAESCQAHAHGFDTATECAGRLHLHHKRLRSQGGRDTTGNIVTICELHHTRAHSQIRAEAEAADIIRRSFLD